MSQTEQLDRLLMRLLTSVSLFADLDRSELLTLIQIAHKAEFPAEQFLFREGDEGESIFVITTGEVEISKTLPKGGFMQIATAYPGDAIGEMALIERMPRNANARAKTTTVALEISHSILKSQTKLELALYRNMARLLARRLRQANEALLGLSDKNIAPPEKSPAPKDEKSKTTDATAVQGEQAAGKTSA